MICLNNTDTIEAGATVNAVVDYTVNGLVSGAFTRIASGQLSDTDPTVIYTASENISIVSIIFVNTHSAEVDINLYVDPLDTGTPRRLTPKDLTLGIDYSLHFDGQRCSILNNNGAVLTSMAGHAIDISVDDTADYYVGDNVESIFAEIGETRNESGWDLLDEDSLCDIAFDLGTRTITLSVKGGQSSYHFWANSKKITKTGDETIVIPVTSGGYYIYFDNDGVIQYAEFSAVTTANFYENALVAWIYYNATKPGYLLGMEQHGKLMSPRTHHYNHVTFGARFESGMDITGLVDGNTTYTNITSGYFWDEDIRHSVPLQTDIPFIHKLGADGLWTALTTDTDISYKVGGDTYHSWNEYTGSTWQLTEGGATTSYWIIFTVVMPALNFNGYAKVIGQNAYSTRALARDAIESEINTLSTSGLPSQEFVFLQAYIVKRDGTLVALANGDTHVDLRIVKGGSASSSSGSNVAADISISDAGNIITATNVEDALQENRTAIDLNTAKDTNVSTALSTGTVGASTYGITSDGGADDVVIAAATNAVSGVATASHITAIEANTSASHTQNTDTNLGAIGTKATPIDADKVIQRDSADSDVIKTSSWTQIKSFLKTYFDTLYNNYVHPNHSGDVTSVADGAQTIADDAVTYAKMQNVTATDRLLGRDTAGAGIVEEIAPAAVRSIINVEDNADVTDSTNVNSAGAVMHSDITPAEGMLRKTASETYTTIKTNLSAVIAPDHNDDTGDGYSVSSPWFDTTHDKAYVCLDEASGAAVWKEITFIDNRSSKGYIMGGQISGDYQAVIEDLIFADETSQTIVATLDTAKYAGTGVSSSIKGYALGGKTGSYLAVIEDLIFADETSQTIVATLDTARFLGAGVSSSIKGYILGGFDGSRLAVIDDLIFADETSQAIVATLNTINFGGAGVNSSTKGYVLGGIAKTAVIEDLIFADETSQTIVATLDTARSAGTGVSSSIKGYILGGDTGSYVAVIDDLIFADETSQAITATLDTAKSSSSGVSSSIKGYALGGYTGSYVAVIEDLIFTDETSQAIVATLDTAKSVGAGVNS